MALDITAQAARILYLLAKAGKPVKKSHITEHTWRWQAHERERAIRAMEDLELLIIQIRPPSASARKPTRFLWLTPAGIQVVADARATTGVRMFESLPSNWQEAFSNDHQ